MSYAPDESAALLDRERGLYDGFTLGAAAYGVLLTLFVQCMHALTQNPRGGKILWHYVVYVFVMFALGNIGYFTHLRFIQLAFVDDREYPGGPLGYQAAHYTSVINITGVVAYFMMNWMADSLVLYRLYVIWERRTLVVAFPTMMFMASFSLSIVELYSITQPGASMFSDSAVNYGLLYWSFSVALNIVVTLLIVSRLMYMRYMLMKTMQQSEAGIYTSVAAMIIESAALYSIAAIIFLVGYAKQIPLQFAVEPVELIQGVCPLMIILRVANGNAWSRETYRSVVPGSMTFAPNPHVTQTKRSSKRWDGSNTAFGSSGDKSFGLKSIHTSNPGDLSFVDTTVGSHSNIEQQPISEYIIQEVKEPEP